MNTRNFRASIIGAAAMAFATTANAQEDLSAFSNGPVFEDFGPAANLDTSMAIPQDAVFRVAFDAYRRGKDSAPQTFISVARLLNMHAKAGVPVDRTMAAIVVHGAASFDLLSDEAHEHRFEGAKNPSREVLEQLLANNVRVILCGQNALSLGIDPSSELLPGVEVALSAMTAHALLQQQGYTVNPF